MSNFITKAQRDSAIPPPGTTNLSFAKEKFTLIFSVSQVKLLFACVD